MSLQQRLSDDLDLSQYSLRKDFKGFMRHAVKLADAFQLVDNGRRRGQNQGPRRNRTDKRGDGGSSSSKSDSSGKKPAVQKTAKREAPPCPFVECKKIGERHWINDCGKSNEHEKSAMRAKIAADKIRDGPSRSTRSQAGKGNNKASGTSARLTSDKVSNPTSTHGDPCDVTVQDGNASIQSIGRCDDGSDDSIASPKLAKQAVAEGIGRMRKIAPVNLQVALRKTEHAETFSFSRIWTVPRTVLHLSSGQLALLNLSYLVADDDLASESLLIGRPILAHLQVDTRTLLEQNRAVLNGADCSSIGNPTAPTRGGFVSRIMLARINRIVDHPRANYYMAQTEEDPFPDPSLLDPLDSEQHDDVLGAVHDMIERSKSNGLPDQYHDRLEKMVYSHLDVFRTGLSSGPAAKLPPLQIALTPDAKPVKVRLRNYSQEQREFLRTFVATLLEKGMVYRNPTAPWAAAPLLVPKPGPAKFRFTVDLRPVNKYTVKHQFPMPNVEQELTKLANAQHYATFDLSHGYWQLPLHENSQALQTFITPDGLYSPTRVLHGTTNAVTHLQSCLTEILPETLVGAVLHWLDDILAHGETVNDLLEAVEQLLKLCLAYHIKLHPAKTTLYSQLIRWCGRLISPEGIKFDPRRLDGLLSMEAPKTGGHLQQFLCALQWVKFSIPNFSVLTTPLHSFMERVYGAAGKRTKRAVSRISLDSLNWGKHEASAFESCKHALAHQVTLNHRDTAKRLCFFTDASNEIWSGMVTQIPVVDIAKLHSEQRHEPLSFLSGRFNNTQYGWSTLEKEAFAILASLERMHWLAATPSGFDLYTDHNNLIFIFDPLSLMPDLSQTAVRKVLRWAVRMSIYNYVCIHIKGEDNVWADLLGRWSAPPTLRRIIKIPVLASSSNAEFDWPSQNAVINVQSEYIDHIPDNMHQDGDLWKNTAGAVWIPEQAEELQLRICIAAHTGTGGHRGQEATEIAIRRCYFWPTLTVDVRLFVKACIHCISTTGGEKVPRPFGPALHGNAANDLLQFDYIEMGPGRNGEKYILILRDDFSGYAWFFPFDAANAENSANAILEWSAAFTVPAGLMSDGGSHFKNETVRLVTRGLRVPHHFTLPYTPWSNGGVERMGKEVLRLFRAILSELQMRQNEWPDLVQVVQSALNSSPSPQRKNIAPVTIFTGLDPKTPVNSFKRAETGVVMNMTDAQQERSMNLTAVQERLANIHPLVQNTLHANRKRAREAASNGKLANFTEGDYVLVARDEFGAGEKLCLHWRGPRRVIKAISEHIFQVEDLRNGTYEDVHACRLKFYSDKSLDATAILSHVIFSETGMPVARLMNLEKTGDGLMVHIRWKGLSKNEDTLEPIERVYEDVPLMLTRLLARKNTPHSLAAEAKDILGL